MSYNEAMNATESDEDTWHVQLASGDVRVMTLDELDEAFQNGVIHENTYLWQDGATDWVTLSTVAGLDSDDDSPQQVESPASSGYAAQPFRPTAHAAADSPWPMAAPALGGGYDAPDIFAPPVQNIGLHSTAPVVAPLRDMDLDFEPVNFKKKRSGGRMLLAATLLGGAVAFGAVKSGIIQFPQSNEPVVAAAIASPVPAAAMPEPARPAIEIPATPKPSPAKALPDDVKERLAKADRARAEKQKAKQQQQSHSAPRSSRGRPSGGEKVFHKGGETGDPLNSAL